MVSKFCIGTINPDCYYCFMRVYNGRIIGKWIHRDNQREYDFRDSEVIVTYEGESKTFPYFIKTKNELSTLIFPEQRRTFLFVMITDTHFTVLSEAGKFITLDRK